MGRVELAPGEGQRPSRPRPWQAVAVAETAGGAGSGRSFTRAPRIGRRTVSSSRRCGEVRCSSRLLRRCDHVTAVSGAYGALNSASASEALDLGPQRAEKCDVPGIFVTGPISPTSLSGGTVTEVRLRVGLPSHPRKPPRPGRLVAATACPGRHETPGTSLGRAQPPRATPSPTTAPRNDR